ncbi:MAG: aminotransferase class I/II-fold pyridoxal phosphate-dependent enzyme [Chitinivibrionia bacterium]|nr:aminotransferase class I/II-fold pyridoxal phosphate-dependent enzyme [Chitinivibrionia bacterium]
MKSKRLLALPPYLFEDLENRYRRAVSSGRDVINLGIGDPDLLPPASLTRRLGEALRNKNHHRYPPQRGLPSLKEAIRRYLERQYAVSPEDEHILVLIGSKEGIAHLPLAVCNPGDAVLVPDPGYPVYHSSALFAGCRPVPLPLEEKHGFLPRFDSQSESDLGAARLCYLNYPNNPTSAVAGEVFFREALDVMERHGIITANDAAYADIYFEERPPVLSAIEGALDRPMIEFFSFSKMLCITGWRAGFAVGNSEVIEALSHLKANVDSGVFGAVQEAIALTLNEDADAFTREVRDRFRERRDAVRTMLERTGFKCFHPRATFYAWVEVPSPWTSMEFALMLLETADVLVTPGIGFGAGGDRFFRIALTCPPERLVEAGERMQAVVREAQRTESAKGDRGE